MQVSTPSFFVFFVAVWLLYWAAARMPLVRFCVLLAANAFFLAKFGFWYLLLPVASSIDFLVGLGLARDGQTEELQFSTLRRRVLLCVSLLVNLSLLLIPKLIALRGAGHGGWFLRLSLSFYCFQALTYTIDLYRRDEDARRLSGGMGYLIYLASAVFFPVLVAGPILRLHSFIKQLSWSPKLTDEQSGRALLLIGIGLVKKLLIADFLGQNLVARVFDTPTLYSGAETIAAVYGYALQLFFDFSGYTDIVLGVGLLLGLTLPENFRQPYLSVNMMEFWRRWHITFSEWLRDYLMDSLPQRRRRYPLLSYGYAVIVTMLLGGLWHGLSWTFLTWGALHGVALAGVRVWKQAGFVKRLRGGRKTLPGGKIAATFLTFNYVCFTWVFFNASSMENAWSMLSRIVSNTWSVDNLTWPIVGVMVLAGVLHCLPLRWLGQTASFVGRVPFWVQGAALAGLVVLIQSISGHGSAPFVYGSF